MRKSSAPSQIGSTNPTFKRPKFCTPFVASTPSQKVGLTSTPKLGSQSIAGNYNDNIGNENANTEEPFTGGVRNEESFQDTFSTSKPIFNGNSCKINKNEKNSSNKPPLKSKENLFKTKPPILNRSTEAEQNEEDEAHILYFNAIWCKLSRKKHKKWEGDAILNIKKSTTILLDLEGKTLGNTRSYEWNQLKDLKEGETLVIGSKEVEVLSRISQEDFNSGKCFHSNNNSLPEPRVSTAKAAIKPFIKHQQAASSLQDSMGRPETVVQVKPPPEGAFVLPKPPATHQWNNNPSHLPVVDVYVDPFLSRHLRPHQKDGIAFLYKCVLGFSQSKGMEGGAILADEMGLGKTLQCLSLIWTLYKQGPYGGKAVLKRILVVVPGSLVKNWVKEFKKWITFERLRVFAVSSDNKVQDFIHSTCCPVMVISYEMLVRNTETLKKVRFDLVVCDEGHRLKNSSIKTTHSINCLDIGRRIVLTGTPVQNDLQELFSLVDFCCPAVLGTSGSFRHVFEQPIMASRQSSASKEQKTLGSTRAQELNRITSQLVLRRTQEINNQYLPPKVDIVLFCSMSGLQISLYNKLTSCQFTKQCIYNTSSSSSSSSQHLTCISALRKVCNHPDLIFEECQQTLSANKQCQNQLEASLFQGMWKIFPSGYQDLQCKERLMQGGKMAVLASLLASFRLDARTFQKVVVVSNYTKTLDLIEKLCEIEAYPSLRLDGRTATNRRHEIVERFNNPHLKDFVFLLSTKAGGVGLNLIGASRLVLFDVDWNPANDLQAMARVWRDGQRSTTYVYRLLATNTIEERMYQRQISKQGLSGVVVDLKDSEAKGLPLFSSDQLKELFSPVLDTSVCLSTTHKMLSCNCTSSGDSASNKPTADLSITDDDFNFDMDFNVEFPSKQQVRPCQLLAPKNKKNSCMDELMNWKHLPGPDPDLSTLDSLLPNSGFSNVTFAFSAESNKQEIV